MLSARECSWFAYEGSCNDTSNSMFTSQHAACNFADVVQFGEGNDILVGSHLKDTIGGGIEDGIASAYMLFAEFFDDLSAGGCFVADDFAANGVFKCSHEVGGET